ncbi:pyruvate dehydrogenase complex dihydrolipoamide acetyltransferase [Prosthecomicrobium sp. N25]|uniref:pyruvate dehydrogenase complex dihydrolipoamide acetyltransferase n=1 Tax=Prosthecomicrobium sp. N25 TaxID=3129254 RepID=UPI00307751AD
MPTNILMPALSPTMEKGNLAKWLKKEGDSVKAGDVLAEIETDKATMEVEAVDEGTLARILVAEGTADVAVNTPIAVLAGEGEDVAAAAGGAGAAPAPQPAAAPKAEAAPAPRPSERTSEATSPAPAGAPAAQPAAASGANRIFSSPLARRIAREAGIDIAKVEGTGPRGRVIQRDVEAAVKAGTAKAGAPAAAPAAAPTAAPAPKAAPAPATSDEAILKLFEPGSYDLVPHDGMRKTIARRLGESNLQVPTFYLTVDCDIGALMKLREEINAAAPAKDGKPAYKISVNDFVIKALALALQRIPDCNVSWTEGAMVKHRHSDVGIAVALPGGLITPIVRKAETKSLSAIANEAKDYAARARARKLKPEEYQGGTTAVSNLGMYGMKHFTAIINPPHATILAVGAGEPRAVVRGGEIKVVQQMTCTLSCDHRAIDGALGAELLAAFRDLIEKPMSMLV